MWFVDEGYRPVCGVVAIGMYMFHYRHWKDDALPLAILILGIVILGGYLLDRLWGLLGKATRTAGTDANPTTEQKAAAAAEAIKVAGKALQDAFQGVAGAIIGVSGILLGLLSVFGQHPLSLTLKVGVASLALTLILSLTLNFIVGLEVPQTKGILRLLGAYVNILIWTLSLGLLSLLMTLVTAK
jgi:hypothetical protein